MLATPGPNGAPVSDPSLYDERIDIVSIAPDFKRQIAATGGSLTSRHDYNLCLRIT
jgi:hypothetical protein